MYFLPNGKLLFYNSNLYYGNQKQEILTTENFDLNYHIPSISYGKIVGTSSDLSINYDFYKYMVCNIQISYSRQDAIKCLTIVQYLDGNNTTYAHKDTNASNGYSYNIALTFGASNTVSFSITVSGNLDAGLNTRSTLSYILFT